MLRDPALTDAAAFGLAYDSSREVSVLYSGVIGTGIEQTWEWDGSDWSFRTDDSPDFNDSAAMVFDSKLGLTLLYNGNSDTWTWDGAAWSVLGNAGDPGIRSEFSMAFDSGRGVTVLFGGFDQESDPLNDTWEYDGITWKPVALNGPDARGYTSMAYDAKRGVTVLYGGSGDGKAFSDTWEWDGQADSFVVLGRCDVSVVREDGGQNVIAQGQLGDCSFDHGSGTGLFVA